MTEKTNLQSEEYQPGAGMFKRRRKTAHMRQRLNTLEDIQLNMAGEIGRVLVQLDRIENTLKAIAPAADPPPAREDIRDKYPWAVVDEPEELTGTQRLEAFWKRLYSGIRQK